MYIQRISIITTLCDFTEEFIKQLDKVNVKEIEVIFISRDVFNISKLLDFQKNYQNSKIHISPIYYQFNSAKTITLKLAHLAKFRWLLIWNFTEIPKAVDLDVLLDFYCENQLLGFIGGIINSQSIQSITMVQTPSKPKCVDFLSRDCLFLERKHYNKIYGNIEISPRFNTELSMAEIANSESLKLIVIPAHNKYFSEPNEWSAEDVKDFTYKVVNSGHIQKKWPEINLKILPKLISSNHFSKLSDRNQFSVTVFGCQRSGTTWINSLLGKCFSNTISFSENQTFDYLLDGLTLSADYLQKVISLQTTFLVSERESYLSASNRLLKIFILRNPLSVCWSLIYHFDALDDVFQYRKTRFSNSVISIFNSHPLKIQKAICLYMDSLETANLLLDKNLILISYENFVEQFINSMQALYDRVAEFSLGACGSLSRNIPSVENFVDRKPLKKYLNMSIPEKKMINSICKVNYLNLKRMCINVSNHKLR
jgi:hypothetical protein